MEDPVGGDVPKSYVFCISSLRLCVPAGGSSLVILLSALFWKTHGVIFFVRFFHFLCLFFSYILL